VSTTDPQMLKGLITLLLLWLLGEREDYGYALVVRLREAGLTDIAEGTVYPALARCERSGWVAAHYVPSERGPARKYYRLTHAGGDELTRLLESWTHVAALVSSITSKGTLR
jgi:PadR family transcriptional regulator PadR